MPRQYTPRVPRVCQHCQKPFMAIPSKLKQGRAKYCSTGCHNEARVARSLANFMERVDISEASGCWLWTAAKIGDYGHIMVRKTGYFAHRLSYELFVGPIPDGMQVLHSCDVPACVNPAHLFLGTQADNMRDMVAKGRQLLGELNPSAKLTEQDVRNIYRAKGPHNEIAEEFGVSRSMVSLIKHGKKWRHITLSLEGR